MITSKIPGPIMVASLLLALPQVAAKDLHENAKPRTRSKPKESTLDLAARIRKRRIAGK